MFPETIVTITSRPLFPSSKRSRRSGSCSIFNNSPVIRAPSAPLGSPRVVGPTRPAIGIKYRRNRSEVGSRSAARRGIEVNSFRFRSRTSRYLTLMGRDLDNERGMNGNDRERKKKNFGNWQRNTRIFIPPRTWRRNFDGGK